MKRKFKHFIAILLVSCLILGFSNISSYVLADDNKYYIGSVTKTGKDNGYSGSKKIDIDDPHYGWDLGRFYLTGYTQSTTDDDDDTTVFLKNVGDKVELRFELLQDIDCLNGDENLTIYADRNGYDQYFGTQKFNDCRGLLIIRKTDYTNSAEDPVIYENYLDGVTKGADTSVELCEEGDYEVALDYEIQEMEYGVDWNSYVGVPFYTNYRISFTFKVRNGNCMVFPFDTVTGSELTNESFTENGFYLDLAKSRYLEINVTKSVYTEGANGYTEDIRFNKPATDGSTYEDEGIYTINVKNLFTDAETEKVIYVGQDPIMKAFVVSGYTPDEIKELLIEGYTISETGQLIAPAIEETIEESIDSEHDNEEISNDNTKTTSLVDADKNITEKKKDTKKSSGSVSSTIGVIAVVILSLVIISAVVVVIILSKKKKAIANSNAKLINNKVADPVPEEDIKEKVITESENSDNEQNSVSEELYDEHTKEDIEEADTPDREEE